MKTGKPLLCFGIVVVVLSFLGCGERQGDSPKSLKASPKLSELTVQWGWIPDGHHAGFYVALEKGYYRARGLNVNFLPGGLDSNPIKAVVSKSADIGQAGGIEQVISARAQGLPVLAFAAIHRDTPHALISLERNPIRGATDLPGKRIAVAYGDAAELLFKAYLSKTGVDPKTIRLEPFRFDLTPLINGSVDAITGFKTDQPVTLKEQGLKPVVLSYSSLGVSSYGYTFFTTENFRAQHPEVVEAFYAASREGFEYAFAHLDEAIAITKKAIRSSFNDNTEKTKLELESSLMLNESGKLSDWSLDPEMIRKVEGYLRDQGQLKEAVAAESLFKNVEK